MGGKSKSVPKNGVPREPPHIYALEAGESSRSRTYVLFSLILFCGIFTFAYWFVFFPLLWEWLYAKQIRRNWFNIICLLVFLAWLLVMLICLVIWYVYNKISPSQRQCHRCNKDDPRFLGPKYETKEMKVQPEAGQEMEVMYLQPGSKKGVVAIPVQPQDTPSMYNLHTGRKSLEIDNDQRKSAEQKPAISPTDSEPSLKDWGILLEKTTDVTVRTKRDVLPTAQHPDKVIMTSVHVESQPQKSDGNLFNYPETSNMFKDEVNGVIVHETAASPIEPFTPDVDRLSQNLPEFNGYLHLVDVEPPLSPREAFFSDLIEQAKKSDGNRRSYCVSDRPETNKPDLNARKSVPLFVYTDKSRENEQSVDSDVEEEKEQTSRSAVVTSVGLFRINDDLKHVTMLMIEAEKQCVQPFVPAVSETELIPTRDVEEFDENYVRPKSGRKPEKLVEEERPMSESKLVLKNPSETLVTEEILPAPCSPKRTESQSEYFIANVGVSKSVTSEVFLMVDDVGTKPCQWEVVELQTASNAGADVLDLELEEDDDVFVDVQQSLSKLKHRHK